MILVSLAETILHIGKSKDNDYFIDNKDCFGFVFTMTRNVTNVVKRIEPMRTVQIG